MLRKIWYVHQITFLKYILNSETHLALTVWEEGCRLSIRTVPGRLMIWEK